MSGMMPLIDTLSYGSLEYHSPPATGKMTQLEQNILATVVIGPYVLAAGAAVPTTAYYSLFRKGRWAVNQLMRPRVVTSINAMVERNEIAAMIRGEPQTISIRPHLVVFRHWRWTALTKFGGVPMLFPWFDIHPKDKKKSKSPSAARSGNAVGPGGGTKKKTRLPPVWRGKGHVVRCRATKKSGKFRGQCVRRKGHSGSHFYK